MEIVQFYFEKKIKSIVRGTVLHIFELKINKIHDYITNNEIIVQESKVTQRCPRHKVLWCFFGQIFQNTPNFANLVHWVWDRNPPINIPNITKKHP